MRAAPSLALLVLLAAAAACLPAPASARRLSQDSSDGGTPGLDAHNKYRTAHAAPPLAWDTKLASQAADFTAKCNFQMQQGLGYGQNLGVTSSADADGQVDAMVDMWYDSSKDYDWSNPSFSMKAGQFTQLVWKGSTKLGCAASACKSISGFGQGGTLILCLYSPPGNIQGAFAKNVARKQ